MPKGERWWVVTPPGVTDTKREPGRVSPAEPPMASAQRRRWKTLHARRGVNAPVLARLPSELEGARLLILLTSPLNTVIFQSR